MATNRSTTTRRTLHYYWQVTRKHFGLFAALMASTFLSWPCYRTATRM